MNASIMGPSCPGVSRYLDVKYLCVGMCCRLYNNFYFVIFFLLVKLIKVIVFTFVAMK